jgi:hypothetical protein
MPSRIPKDYNIQDHPYWFVPGWFEPITNQDKQDAKNLCAILQKKRDAELAKRTLPAMQGPAPCPQYERGDL